MTSRAARWTVETLEGRQLLASLAQLDGVAYLPNANGTQFERYDVANEQWLAPVVLSGSPGGMTASAVDADGIYAAYGTSVFRYHLDGSAATHVTNASFDVQRLFTDGNLLLIDESLSSRGEFLSVNKDTNLLIDAQSIAVDGISGSSIARGANKIFGHASTGTSANITYVTYDDAGHFVDSGTDDRFDGVYLAARQTWTFPSGASIVDDFGSVYSASNLARVRSLGTHVDDIAFVGGATPVVLYGKTLTTFAPTTLLPTGSATLARSATQLIVNDRDAIAFVADASAPHSYATQAVPLADLRPFQPSTPVNPNGLAYKPDEVEVARDGTLLLLSAANRSIFRFDPQTLAYRSTIPLQGIPKFMAYSAENRSAYLAYESGLITRVDLTAAQPTEQAFLILPALPNGFATAGAYIFATVSSYNWQLAMTFGPDGSPLSRVDLHYSSREFVWSNPNSKLYYLASERSFDALMADSINPDGTIGGVSEQRSNTTWSERPLRVSPDGKTVILGSGAAYDAVTFRRLAVGLANAVSDVAWIGDDVYTVRTVNGLAQFQRWAGASYTPAEVATAPGAPIALQALGDGRLLGIFINSGVRAAPIFRLMNAQLQTLAESTLPPLPSLEAASIGVAAGNGVEGTGSLQLVGSATELASGQSVAKWEYDFDYDGVTFTADASGSSVATMSYSVADGPSTRLIAVRVTDNYGQIVIRTRTVSFTNVAPRATFAAATQFGGDPQLVTFAFSAIVDATADVAAGFSYSFDFNNDGDFDDASDLSNTTLPSASFRFDVPGLYTVRGRITDKDGGFRDYTRTIAVSDGTNLAAGKTTTALSSVNGFPPSNATDVESTTDWVAPASDANWLQVDLGAFYRVASIYVAFNGGAPGSFQLQTSTDGTIWASASSTTGNTANTAHVSGLATTARFVRVLFTKRNGSASYRVGDLRVTGVPSVAPAPTSVGWDPLTALNEGSTASLAGRASPLASGQTIVEWEWDFDYDGTTFGVDATGQTVQFALPDSSVTRNVAVRVTDNYGQVAIGRRSLTPVNIAPTATLAVVTAGPGKATATFTNVVDPGTADVAGGFRYSFDFNNDGNFSGPGEVNNGTTPTATGSYAEPGTYTVASYVYDRDGGFTKYLSTVTVATPPPPSKFGFYNGVFYEGTIFELYGYVEELPFGQAVTKWEYDFDYDGRTFDVDGSDISENFDARQIDGLARRTIGIRVTDRFGQTATVAQELIIRNAIPIASLQTSVSSQFEGRGLGTIRFANQTDAVAADRAAGFRYSYDFNGDGDFADDGEIANSPEAARSYLYPRPGTYPVTARITDKDGGAATLRAEIVVAGPQTPIPSITAAPSYEGRQSTLDGGVANAGAASVVSWDWDLDYVDGAFASDVSGQFVTFDATDLDGPTSRLVALRVTDSYGRTAIVTRNIHVLNAAPTAVFAVDANSDGTATATLSRVSDPGAADAAAGFRYSFDFNGDGDFLDPGEVDRGASPTANGTYAAGGTYTVIGYVFDRDNAFTKYTSTVTVVPLAPAPTLTSFVVNDGAAQRSMVKSLTLTFDKAVSLGAAAIALTTQSGTAVSFVLSPAGGASNQYVLTFAGSGIVGGSLADGRYTLMLNGAGVTAAGSAQMAGSSTYAFHRMFGDVDGDRDVDATDSRGFRAALDTASTQAAYRWYFDFDGDGDVDATDSRAFRGRLDTILSL